VRAKNSGTLVKGQKNNFKIFDFGYLIFFQMDFRIGPLPLTSFIQPYSTGLFMAGDSDLLFWKKQ
tara:strand:- start:193 stop:387 length:195 start_codon:yes stop_codon:yes gene_type:complete